MNKQSPGMLAAFLLGIALMIGMPMLSDTNTRMLLVPYVALGTALIPAGLLLLRGRATWFFPAVISAMCVILVIWEWYPREHNTSWTISVRIFFSLVFVAFALAEWIFTNKLGGQSRRREEVSSNQK